MKKNLDVNSMVTLSKTLSEIVLPITKNFNYDNLKACDKLKLIELANKNFMNFALYQGLVKNRLEKYFTDEELNYLQEFYNLNKQRNTDFINELRGVIADLNRCGIEPVLLKGAVALADNWYSGMGARFMRDIDFLVPENQVEEAYKILKGIGYQEVHEEDDDHTYNHGHHHCPALQKPYSALVIEIHSKPLSTKTRGVLNSQQVLSEKKWAYNLNLGRCYIPSPTHCLLIAIMHTEISHGHRDRGVLSLRHAMDVARILEKYNDIDLSRIESQLISYGFKGLFSSYLFVLNNFFNIAGHQGYISKISGHDEYLNQVLNTMSKARSINRYKFDFYKNITTNSFSKDRISSRYRVINPLSINLYRVVNLVRLIFKYSDRSNWEVKSRIIESETSVARFIGK